MSFKTITVKQEAYDVLMQHKGEKESFSDFFLRTYKPTKQRSPLWELVGILTTEETDEMRKTIAENRKRWTAEVNKRSAEIAKALDARHT